MHSRNLKMLIHRDPWQKDYGVLLVADRPDGSHDISTSITMEHVPLEKQGMCMTVPTFHLSPDHAQQLFEELWKAGIRPLDGSGNPGHIGALERHLHDMRALVFKTDVKAKP
jgi:hypothetical protein